MRVLGTWLAALAIATFGIGRLALETNANSTLERSGAEWAFYQESMDEFGNDQVVVVALEGVEAYSPELLRRIDDLTNEFSGIPGVHRVDSLASVPAIRVDAEGSVVLDPALERELLEYEDAGAKVAANVVGDRILRRSLVSTDGHVFALNVVPERQADDLLPELYRGVLSYLPSGSVWISGVPVVTTEAMRLIEREILLFVPITLIVIGAFLILVFKSPAAAAISLLTSGTGTWILLGVMGALGVPLAVTTIIVPSVILALGCSYVMHLLSAAAGHRTPAEISRALEPVLFPIFLSGVTTSIGFTALALVRIEAIRNVGAFGSLGVLTVLIATLTAVPAFLCLFPLPEHASPLTRWIRGGLRRRLEIWVTDRREVVLGLWGLGTLVLAVGLSQVVVETDATRWFARGHEVREAYEEIRARLSGISPMNVVVQSQGETKVTDPAVLEAIDRLTSYLESLPEVGKAVSFADPLRQLHGRLSDEPGDPLPGDATLISQYLLLLESVEQMGDLLSFDRSSASVALRVDDNSSRALLALAEAAEKWWTENGDARFHAQATGIMFEFARTQDEIAWGQIRGISFSIASIAIVLLLTFRSLRMAGLAIIPNIAPLMAVFGFMGLWGIPLDAGTVMMGSLAIGIAVDDAMHVVSGFVRENQAGADAPSALGRSLDRTLPALVFSTIAIGLGFVTLGLSEFAFIRNFGLLTAAIMVLCLLANVTLLPALLSVWGESRRAISGGRIAPSPIGDSARRSATS